MPNKLSQFWQELKRRNVVRVATVYAGAAFVIIELINNITEPLRLPEWTPSLVIVLLAIGFPIVIIFSWIYDMHPEGGMVKTESINKVKPEEKPTSSSGWKIASYVSFVVIVGLIVLNIIPHSGKKKVPDVLDKSIVVLPFINESPELEKDYLINSYRTAVHDNLCRIKQLRVLSLESTERYQHQSKSKPEIAKELGVGYLLSARGQLINNKMRLTVQLANAKDDILWSRPYDRQIELVEDHIDIQSEIAKLVAGEIQAAITPEEKELMGKIPTSSLTAYDLYLRGWEVYHEYLYKDDLEALERAEDYYHEALKIDPNYALAYVGLADITWDKTNMEEFFKENFLDSVLVLVNLALSYDEQSSEAYTMRGNYYRQTGNNDLAIKDFEKANSDYSSICQFGIGEFTDGVLSNTYETLIDPEDYFDEFHSWFHGILPEDVVGKPKFDHVHEKLNQVKDYIILNYSSFDRSAYRQACEKYNLSPSLIKFLDTSKVVRRTWDQFRYGGYGLGKVAESLNITFKHHNALEDAIACGKVFFEAVKQSGFSIEQWEDRIKLRLDGQCTEVHRVFHFSLH